MKMKLMAATAIAALAAATGASAQVTGFYAAADFGYHWPYDYVGKSSVNPPNNATTNTPGANTTEWRFRPDNDWVAFGRLGYQFNPNWRRARGRLPPRRSRLRLFPLDQRDPARPLPGRRDAYRGLPGLRPARRQPQSHHRDGQRHL